MAVTEIVEVASMLATPFLKNPQLFYLLVLLIVGVDSFQAMIQSEVASELPAGTVYIIDQDFFGNKVCSTTTATALASQVNVPTYQHLADSKEMLSLCGADEKVQGVVGRVLTELIKAIGFLSGNDYLQTEVTILSWEIFILMVMLPLIVFVLTASVQAH